MNVSPRFPWPDGHGLSVQQTHSPSQPLAFPPLPCLSPSLCLPPSLLPACPFAFHPLFLFLHHRGQGRIPELAGSACGNDFVLRESQRKTARFVKVSESSLLAEQTVCAPAPRSVSASLWLSCLSLCVCHCLSSCVCVSLSRVRPLSCRGWAPWALWRIAGREAERKRSCVSSCTGTRLRELLSPARISTSMTWQVVLELQGGRSHSVDPEVARLETVCFWTGVWVKQRWWL